MDAVKIRRAGGTECLDALYMLLVQVSRIRKVRRRHVISNFFLFKNSKSGSAKFFLEQTPFFLKPPVSSRGHSRVVMVVVVVMVAVIMVVNATRGQLIARYFERFLRVLDGRRREILTNSTRAEVHAESNRKRALGLASDCSLQFLRWLLRRRTSRGTSRVLRWFALFSAASTA